MSDLKRLVQSSPNPRTRELLEAGLQDRPNAPTMSRLGAALGVGTAATLGTPGTLASAASLAAAKTTVGAAGLGMAAAGSAALAMKWIALGLVAGGLVAGGAASLVHQAEERNVVAARVFDRARSGFASAADSAPNARLEPLDPSPEPTSDRNFSGSRGAAKGPSRSPVDRRPERDQQTTTKRAMTSVERASRLASDVALIDGAKRALGRGDAQGALRDLDVYQRSGNTGVLDREAMVLQFDALVAAGASGKARELARRYVERYPEDAHARRLREFLNAAPADGRRREPDNYSGSGGSMASAADIGRQREHLR